MPIAGVTALQAAQEQILSACNGILTSMTGGQSEMSKEVRTCITVVSTLFHLSMH
jgi:hypothetical protein